MWTRGTQLRNKDGIYQWPPEHLGVTESTRLYPSVTSIIDCLDGSDMAFVHGTYIGQHVRDLVELAKQRANVVKWEKVKQWDGTTGHEQIEVPAKDALADVEYTRMAGFRRLRQDADRGSVIHELISQWCEQRSIDADELPEWIEHHICEGQHSCSVDEVLPYAKSALHWLEKVKPQCIRADVPVFNDGRKDECPHGWGLYAGTLDFIGLVGGRLFVLDFKTSKASRRAHAMQLAAYKHAKYIGVKGTSERVPMIRVEAVASVLIQPEKVTFREWTSTEDWFKAFRHAIHAYRRLRGNMNVSTLERFSTKTPLERKQLELVSGGAA